MIHLSSWFGAFVLAAAQTGGLRAELRGPERVHLGEPFELTVLLHHDAGLRPELLPDAVGEGFVVLEELDVATTDDPVERGLEVTEFRWSVVALEPTDSERGPALPTLMAALPDGSLEAPFVAPEARGPQVVGLLAPDEAEARPPHGFRDAPAAAAGSSWLPTAVGALVAGLVSGLVAFRSRRRKVPAPADEPSPLERLSSIDPRAADGAGARAAYYELTAAVREGIDARTGSDRRGLTDPEWLAALDGAPGVSSEERGLLGELLETSAAVKYGGRVPTHWALEEALSRARGLLRTGSGEASTASAADGCSIPALALLAQVDEPVQSAAATSLHLFGDYYLGDPWFLILIPIALGALAYGRGRAGRATGRVSTLPGALARVPRSLVQRLAWVPAVLQALALVGVIVALARPVRGNVLKTTTSEGVDIALLVDRSGSMKYEDLEPGRSRLDVVKEVVGDFAVRRMTDRVGASDNVALLTFARYPQLLCPFTLDAGALTGFLEGVEVVKHEVEDGTAIGRGLAKAVALLTEMDARSKVCVLLTDGKNNVEDIPPLEAARAAAEAGIKVYTVLAGRYVYQEDVFGRIYPTERELDSSELEAIAQLTGARFFRARDRAALEAVYAEIEAAERTERTEERYTETFDLYPPFLLAAALLYLAAWTSYATWARRLA